MKKVLLVFLLLRCSIVSSGQNSNPIVPNTSATIVIASGGLRLREKPSTSSRVLTTIPFGSKISYVSDQSFGEDDVSYLNNDGIATKVRGCWVKVSFNQLTGFVLDIYLFWDNNTLHRFPDTVNNEFILLYPGCGCNSGNFYDPAKWKWYGYFENEQKGLSVEPIEIRYLQSREYTCDLILTASKTQNLLFIIGTKHDVPNRKGLKLPAPILISNFGNPGDSLSLKKQLANVSLLYEQSSNEQQWHAGTLHLIKNGRKQLLNRDEYGDVYSVEYIGDIDGDGQDDYIIQYGDKGSKTILYLTSKAKEGELIHLMAAFYGGYCC